MQIRVADYIAGYLSQINARTVFMLSGGMMMHLIDAVGRQPDINYFCNFHEQASAMAADTYARVTGKLGVCYATSGPGATNTITGIIGAWQDSSPVLFITGQSKLIQTIQNAGIENLRQYGVFEVDIIPIVKSITKYAVFIDDPNKIRYHLEKAVYIALTGRPGPVLLDIPLDIQGSMIDPDRLQGYDDVVLDIPTPSDEEIEYVINEFKSAKRPLILCGHGVRVADAVEKIHELVNLLNCPVVTTQLAKDSFKYSDPFFVGHPGLRGDRAGNFAIQNADLILSFGCSFHNQTIGFEQDLFAPHAKKIQVEIDNSIVQRSKGFIDKSIYSDTKVFVTKLIQELEISPLTEKWGNWQDRCKEWKKQYSIINEPHNFGTEEAEINYYEFVDILSDILPGGETVISDAGSSFYVMGQAFKLKINQRFISSGSLGSMGFSLPASIGAAIGRPNQMVVCVTGDGSLQSNIQELQTIQNYNLDIKMFIMLNDGYVSIRNTQKAYFNGFLVGSSQDTGVTLPNLKDLANTYKIPYVDCLNRKQLKSSITKTLGMKGPVICGIHSQTNQVILPGVGSEKMPNGDLKSKPLHEMQPLLNQDEQQKNMLW